MRTRTSLGLILAVLLFSASAEAARNFQLKGKNELGGGIGFSAGLADWTPGGFKWFNDYSRELGKLVWLNVQLNIGTGGGYGSRYCPPGTKNCVWSNSHFGGTSLELAVGVKLKWRLRNIPLQFHAKIGGCLDGLFIWGYEGLALGPRGGFGIRYFFVPTFGLGAELVWSIGPAFINGGVGTRLWSTLDFNVGIEWRF